MVHRLSESFPTPNKYLIWLLIIEYKLKDYICIVGFTK